MINVSELIGDHDFCQPNGISVTRRKVEIVNHEPVTTTQQLSFTGVITINSDRADEMRETSDITAEVINVFTYTPLYTAGKPDEETADNYLADIVTWQGVQYKVISCMDDEQYGFCKSIAEKLRQDVM